MLNLNPFHLHIRGLYITMMIFLLLAIALGAVVGVYWRDEYGQCLAQSGGFQKILAGTCVAVLQ
jgi:hypothetical protein